MNAHHDTTSRPNICGRLAAAVCIVFALGGGASIAIAQEHAGTPDISGTWVLNHEASERVGPPVDGSGGRGRDRGNGQPPGGRGGGRGGMGRGGMGRGARGGGAPPDPATMNRTRDLMDEIMTPSERLIVMQRDDAHVTLVDADGHSRTYTTNNEKEQHQWTNGTVQTKTRWESGALILTVAVDKGPTVVQTFTPDVEHHRLRLALAIDGARDRGGRSRTMVYDAATP